MAFKPNYRQERAERDRRARIRIAEKQQARDEKTSERRAALESNPEVPSEDEGGGS